MRSNSDEKIIRRGIANKVAEEVKKIFCLNSVLYLNLTEFSVFSEVSKFADIENVMFPKTNVSAENILVGDPTETMLHLKKKFDLIVGDLPLGMGRVEMKLSNGKTLKMKKNWGILYSSLLNITEEGYGLYLIEPAVWSLDWKKFNEVIELEGYFVNAILNTPENVLKPYTSLRPNIVLISKKRNKSLFVAELREVEAVERVIRNLAEERSSDIIEEGIFIDKLDFEGFDQFKYVRQIDRLNTQYKGYAKHRLSDISLEINLGKQNSRFEVKNNAVYIPKVGNSPVVSDLSETTLKHQNYFQVVLSKEVANNKYVALFFASELGRLILKSLFTGTVIKTLGKNDLQQVFIPMPNLAEQEKLVGVNNKINKLDDAIAEFRGELSLNPRGATAMLEKIEDMLGLLSALSESDRIRAIVRKGESKTGEFKQTLSLDIKKGTKEKYIAKSALKTIVAFLNTEGGVLLVGVTDEGVISGVQEEISKFYKNEDKYLRHFKDLIKEHIGEEFFLLIDYNLVDVDEKKVLYVEIKPSAKPCYFENKEFYIRTIPATEQLAGPQLVEYVKNHFKT